MRHALFVTVAVTDHPSLFVLEVFMYDDRSTALHT